MWAYNIEPVNSSSTCACLLAGLSTHASLWFIPLLLPSLLARGSPSVLFPSIVTRLGRSPFLRTCLPCCVGPVASAHASFETGSTEVCGWENVAWVSYGPAWADTSVFVSMGPGGRAL